MKPKDARQKLVDELAFFPATAVAYVRARGRCEYCGRELIQDRLGYACAQIDHILPRRYEEFVFDPDNFALSCSLCNNLKGSTSVLHEGESPGDMLKNHRTVLINRARRLVEERLQDANAPWNKVCEIFASLKRSEPS